MRKLEETIKIDETLTKRKILSLTQKIFDPVGSTTSATFIPKLILQETWKLNLKWDEKLPESLKGQFASLLKQIEFLNQIKMPRCLNILPENETKNSLHLFSKAIRRTYAAYIYLRTQIPEGIGIEFVSARTREAPIKELTIPRLELLSCLIGVRLTETIKKDSKLEPQKKHFGLIVQQL